MARGATARRNGKAQERVERVERVESTELVEVSENKELDIFHKTMGIRSIVEMRRLIRFDLAIQRNEVWKETKDVHQKSLLIDSILRKYPIGQVFVIQMGDEFMWMADGKQRWTTIFKYVDNGFAIAKGMRPVKATDPSTGETKMYDIEGKFFKDLDKVLQSKILSYEMDVKFLHNATPEEVEEIFLRLNNGTPLTKIELTRVELGEENMVKIATIAEKRLFKTMAAISESARNRFIDNEMILQILILVTGRDSGISGNEIRQFAKVLKQTGITDEMFRTLDKTSDYLQDAFEQFVIVKDGKEEMPLLNKMLKKVHLPIIFLTAMDAIKQEILPEVFGLWVKSFFLDRKTPFAYKDASGGGSAKKENVNRRITAMKDDYKKTIDAVLHEWEEGAVLREQLAKEEEERAKREAEEALKAASTDVEPDGDGKEEDGKEEGSNELVNDESDKAPSEELTETQEDLVEVDGGKEEDTILDETNLEGTNEDATTSEVSEEDATPEPDSNSESDNKEE